MTTTTYAPRLPVSTREVVAETLPVDLPVNTWRTMLRLVVPVCAGDWLDVHGWARVTNDTGRDRGDAGYTVGVGWHLWAYDVDDGKGAARTEADWRRISPLKGDNVTRQRHHMPMDISTLYQVPADWPEGHRMVVVLRADAHSTAWKAGDTLTVDREYGELVVRPWCRTPNTPVEA
ncbi:hypothetical protein ABZW67_15270 [Streptomyces rubiginosohelvolus]|uniref:hypothetical protein n=1 Tax=Streptomyces rubiginosohelvolus TaxID=67362 RepID=UPI0033A7B35A